LFKLAMKGWRVWIWFARVVPVRVVQALEGALVFEALASEDATGMVVLGA